jgi:hypothetical protein
MPQPNSNFHFGIWLPIFFSLLFAVPLLTYYGFLNFAKFLGVTCLILISVALRIWLRISGEKRGNIRRIVLNNNQIFDLERKYYFLKKLDGSTKKTILERSGIVLAELNFIQSIRDLDPEIIIELAFNIAIIYLDRQHLSQIESKINFNSDQIPTLSDILSLSDLPISNEKIDFEKYKIALKKSDFGVKVENIFFS